ncbi:PD-(D/E)XK nuclease family protein [Tepidibacillus marianensis]|uniref:PD-(D/E)XK nuclease family protein n=1 Tax=Tepidibacillus marianensis TaxID=3131995 RepID=UPI0030CBCA17
MKKIILYNTYIPLGTGLQNIQLLEDNRKWIYLIPSATLFTQVKEVVCQLDYQQSRRVEIMTFDQMLRAITTDAEMKKILTSSKQELILKKAVEKVNREQGFQYFLDSIHTNGWLHQIEIWLGETRRAGVTPTQLSTYWADHSQKYQELIWIYQAYHQLLQNYLFIDHEEPYFEFLSKSNLKRLLERYQGIITDQFYDFSPIQMNVLGKMGDVGISIQIHLANDPKRSDLFQWTQNTIQYLQDLNFIIEQAFDLQFETRLSHSLVIQQIRDSLFAPFPAKQDAHSAIHLFEATGTQKEIEKIAAEIKDLVWNQNKSLEQMAVIVPRLEKYEDTLHRVMESSGIPIRLAKRERMVDNPFIQAITSLLKAMSGRKEHWLSVILSPYFSWEKEISPERWMMIYRECGSPITRSKWDERFQSYLVRNEANREALQNYDVVMQQLFDLKDSFLNKGRHQTYVQYLERLEKTLKMKENIQSFFIQHPLEKAAFRDLKAYEHWKNLKQELIEMDMFIESDETLTFSDWFQSLMLACEQTNYSYHQGKQEGLYVVQPNQIRGRQFDVIFFLGLVEGEFPRSVKNDWLMSDEDRRELRQMGVQLTQSTDYEKQQKYQFFQSLTAATDQIYLLYSAKTEEGKEQLRSFFIDEVLDLFQKESIDHIRQDISEIVPMEWNKCTTIEQLTDKIYYDLNQHTGSAQMIEANVRKELLQKENWNRLKIIERALQMEHERNQLHSSYDGVINDPVLIQEVKQQISQKVWSTTQLNEASLCRFSYLSTHFLRLSEWEEQEESLTPIEKGDLFHRILQRFFDRFRQEKQEKFSPDQYEMYRKWILDIAEEEWQSIQNQPLRFLHPILSDLDWKRILQDVKQIIEHEIHWRGKSSSYFYPQFLELSFGLPLEEEELQKGDVDPASQSDYAKVTLNERIFLLRGKIDRVDRNDQGQYVVYDYKSGQAPNSKEIREAINLQLPIYLFVLETLFGLGTDQAIGASFYTRGEIKKQGEKPTDNRNKGIWKSEWLDHVGLSKK